MACRSLESLHEKLVNATSRMKAPVFQSTSHYPRWACRAS